MTTFRLGERAASGSRDLHQVTRSKQAPERRTGWLVNREVILPARHGICLACEEVWASHGRRFAAAEKPAGWRPQRGKCLAVLPPGGYAHRDWPAVFISWRLADIGPVTCGQMVMSRSLTRSPKGYRDGHGHRPRRGGHGGCALFSPWSPGLNETEPNDHLLKK
jgi:hypothetical protein